MHKKSPCFIVKILTMISVNAILTDEKGLLSEDISKIIQIILPNSK